MGAIVDGVNGSKSQRERGGGAEGAEPVRHGVGGVVAERGADDREECGDLRDAEAGLRCSDRRAIPGDPVGEVPGGDGDPGGEERAYRERDPQKEAQREQQGVARWEDDGRVGALWPGGADEEAAHLGGLGRRERPGEGALSEGARFEIVAGGVDDPRAPAEVHDDVQRGEGRGRERGEREEHAASRRRGREPWANRHQHEGEGEGYPLGTIAREAERRHRRRLLLRGAADNGCRRGATGWQ